MDFRYDKNKPQNQQNVAVIAEHYLQDGTKFIAIYGHVRTTVGRGSKLETGKPFAKIGPWDFGDHLHFGILDAKATPDRYGRYLCPPKDAFDPKTLDKHDFSDPMVFLTTNSPGGIPPTSAGITAQAPTQTPKIVPPTTEPTKTPDPTKTAVRTNTISQCAWSRTIIGEWSRLMAPGWAIKELTFNPDGKTMGGRTSYPDMVGKAPANKTEGPFTGTYTCLAGGNLKISTNNGSLEASVSSTYDSDMKMDKITLTVTSDTLTDFKTKVYVFWRIR